MMTATKTAFASLGLLCGLGFSITACPASLEEVTYHHVLTHTSGIGEMTDEELAPIDSNETALQVIGAWRDLARDLLMVAAGRPQLVAAVSQAEVLRRAAPEIDRRELIAFLALAGRIADGLRENAAPRLALEVAMLAWPRVVAPAPAAT